MAVVTISLNKEREKLGLSENKPLKKKSTSNALESINLPT